MVFWFQLPDGNFPMDYHLLTDGHLITENTPKQNFLFIMVFPSVSWWSISVCGLTSTDSSWLENQCWIWFSVTHSLIDIFKIFGHLLDMGVLLLNYMFVIFFFRDCDLRKCLHTHLDPMRSWKRGWITLGFEEDKKRRKILDRDRLPLTHATLSLFGYLFCSLLTPINYSSAFFFPTPELLILLTRILVILFLPS